MLNEIIEKKTIEARAIVAFYPCNSNEDDDIEIYDENDGKTLKGKWCTLRQQLDKDQDNYSSTTTPMADLEAKDYTGNEDPFGNIETATTKADKLTEEERLRRIRRLMLNRYGREDTILTGAKDPFNRRRYARSL